jgi:bifunctional non-homologous end joining protein LigD
VCSTAPLIVAGALKLRRKHFAIDSGVVVLRPDGISDFDALASRRHDKRAQFYASGPQSLTENGWVMPGFLPKVAALLAGDGEDYRPQALSLRKANLTRLLKHRVDGTFTAEYGEGDIGRNLFRAACRLHLEGILGRCKHWPKTKNPAHPAYSRV